MSRTNESGVESPVGLSLRIPAGHPEPLRGAVEWLLQHEITVAEIPCRIPVEGGNRRISELSGRALRGVLDLLGRLRRLSYHGPIGNMFLSNPEVRRAVVNSVREAVREAALLGAGVMVLHVEPTFPNLEFRGWGKEGLAEQLYDLAEFAACYAVKVAVETQYPYTVEEFVALVDEVNHANFGATLDVGHLFDRRVPHHTYIDMELFRSPEGPATYNRLLQDLTRQLIERGKLFHIHLHQHRREALVPEWSYGSCDHWSLHEGIIDIPAFLRIVRPAGYGGLVVCELSRGRKGPHSGSITDQEVLESIALAKRWWDEASLT